MSEFRRSVARKLSTSASARSRRAALQRILPLAVLSLGLIGMPTLLITNGGLGRLSRLQAERDAVRLETSRLKKRIVELKAAAQDIKHDPRAVERSARDELGLLRRSEIVFHFEQAERD